MLNIFHKIKEYFAPKKEPTIDEIRSVVRDEIKNMRGIQILDKSPARCELSPTLNTPARSENKSVDNSALIKQATSPLAEQIYEILLKANNTMTIKGLARATGMSRYRGERVLKPILDKWRGELWVAQEYRDLSGVVRTHYRALRKIQPQQARRAIRQVEFYTASEVAQILPVSECMLSKIATPTYKEHPDYLEFLDGRSPRFHRKCRLYPRQVVRDRLIQLGASQARADEALRAFDMENTK